MRDAVGLCILALAVAAPAAAPASELAAYDLDNTDWNGLSSLALVAAQAGVTLEQRASVDLAEPGIDVLFVVYPTVALDAAGLAAWVRAGGALVVADDFGSSASLAARFGLDRVPAGPAAASFQDDPNLPVVARVGQHPLSRTASTLALNHPAGLRADGLPVFAFADGTGVVYDMSLGQGTAVFVSDPSLMTNLMLPLHGNASFVTDLFARTCPTGRGCRGVLVSEDGSVRGTVAQPGGRGMDGLEERLRAAARRIRDGEVDPRALRVAAWALAAGMLVLFATAFPRVPPSWLRAQFRFPATRPLSTFEFALHRLTGRARHGSFVLPAVLLRDRFFALFYPALGLPAPGAEGDGREYDAAAAAYVRRFEAEADAARRRAVSRTLRQLGRLPTRSDVTLSRAAWVDAKDLLRWSTEVRTILEKMRLDERYRDQIRRPGPHLR